MNTTQHFPFWIHRLNSGHIRALGPKQFEIRKLEYFPPPFDITAGRFTKKERPGYWRQLLYTQDSLPLDLLVHNGPGGMFRRIKRQRLLKRWSHDLITPANRLEGQYG